MEIKKLSQLKEKETLVFEKLKQTYGNGTIDLETGEFKPTIE